MQNIQLLVKDGREANTTSTGTGSIGIETETESWMSKAAEPVKANPKLVPHDDFGMEYTSSQSIL